MNVKEFIEKWNKAFDEGKVNIYIAENNLFICQKTNINFIPMSTSIQQKI